ncbi:DUF3566 domain-containing protein [Geodermatophilus sabuli]|uniref:DUF3566 domain-containing protein n=1 Tax=Geodermatophilus sabuli TaxID=1564158 RepID=A0A7K3W5K1_9ACTN|nr:DUF3566 domain-containing protein [Geodermatophilus sabuli]NEK60165.1 DUF3566 domain-containing protein [Geodermatophilus sabuli]
MSDRTQGSVRTGSRPGGTSPAQDTASGSQVPSGGAPPVSATQSIPGTGSQRAQVADGTAPVADSPVSMAKGSTASAATAVPAAAPAAEPAGPIATVAPAPTGPVRGAPAPAAGSAKESPAGRQKGARGPRRARLQLRHIDTWSALKISLVLSIALFFIWMVAVGVLYGVLSGLGVFETLNDLFGQLGTASGSDGATEVITPGIVFGGAAVIGAINIVLMTALCTVAAFIYNMCSDLVGGLEVTLSERD